MRDVPSVHNSWGFVMTNVDVAQGNGHQPGFGIEEPTIAIKIEGVVKWFDLSKGFGFIVPDGGLPDVLLHVTCLQQDGFQAANEGARIVCEAVQRPKGLQAIRILSMDESKAFLPAPPQVRTHPQVEATHGPERATVKWFNRVRGFGFLTRGEGTADIFVHMQILRSCGILELQPGQTVIVRYGESPKGLMAAEVTADKPAV